MVSATWLTNAMTSWSVVRSISAMRSASTRARASMAASAPAGTTPRRACARVTASSTSSIRSNRACIGPDRAHLGQGVARDHRAAPATAAPAAAGPRPRHRDVVAALEPAERDRVRGRLGRAARFREVRAAADDGQRPGRRSCSHAPPSRRVPAWKTRAPPLSPRSRDRVAAPRLPGIALAGEHDADRRARQHRAAASGHRRGSAPRAAARQQRRQRDRESRQDRPAPRDRRGARCTPGAPVHRPSASAPRTGTRGRACRAGRAPRGPAGGTVSRIASTAASSRSASGEYAPMPPVFGPSSPSRNRLWSRAAGSATRARRRRRSR